MKMLYAAVLVGLVMLSYGCIAVLPPANGTGPPPVITNTTPPGPNATNASNPPGPTNPAGLTKEICEQARGHWNECGSACRGAPPETPCIMMCVQYCECGGIAGFGCPDGYECTDYLPKDKLGNPVPDAMGICKKIVK